MLKLLLYLYSFIVFRQVLFSVVYWTKNTEYKITAIYRSLNTKRLSEYPYKYVNWCNREYAFYVLYHDYSPMIWYKFCSELSEKKIELAKSIVTLQWLWGYPLFIIMQCGGTRIVSVLKELLYGSLWNAVTEFFYTLSFLCRLLITIVLVPFLYLRDRKQLHENGKQVYFLTYEETLTYKQIESAFFSFLPLCIQNCISEYKERKKERKKKKKEEELQQAWLRKRKEEKEKLRKRKEEKQRQIADRQEASQQRRPSDMTDDKQKAFREAKNNLKAHLRNSGLSPRKVSNYLAKATWEQWKIDEFKSLYP